MNALKDFFSKQDEAEILNAIRQAEARTSGEIRVRLEKKADKDPMLSARKAFESLGMRRTKQHNGVLFFLAVEDRKFVVLGDDEIDRKVPKGFWASIRDAVLAQFQKGLFARGLAIGIQLAGEQLAAFYPCEKGDINELPNDISYADEETLKQ